MPPEIADVGRPVRSDQFPVVQGDRFSDRRRAFVAERELAGSVERPPRGESIVAPRPRRPARPRRWVAWTMRSWTNSGTSASGRRSRPSPSGGCRATATSPALPGSAPRGWSAPCSVRTGPTSRGIACSARMAPAPRQWPKSSTAGWPPRGSRCATDGCRRRSAGHPDRTRRRPPPRGSRNHRHLRRASPCARCRAAPSVVNDPALSHIGVETAGLPDTVSLGVVARGAISPEDAALPEGGLTDADLPDASPLPARLRLAAVLPPDPHPSRPAPSPAHTAQVDPAAPDPGPRGLVLPAAALVALAWWAGSHRTGPDGTGPDPGPSRSAPPAPVTPRPAEPGSWSPASPWAWSGRSPPRPVREAVERGSVCGLTGNRDGPRIPRSRSGRVASSRDDAVCSPLGVVTGRGPMSERGGHLPVAAMTHARTQARRSPAAGDGGTSSLEHPRPEPGARMRRPPSGAGRHGHPRYVIVVDR